MENRVIKFTTSHENAIRPKTAHVGDAGFDLHTSERVVLPPKQFTDVPTGLCAAFPSDVWARIVGRSSTIRARGLLVVEGIIDQGYTGPLFAGVFNLQDHEIVIEAGERLAQLIPQLLVPCDWQHTEELPTTSRGAKGFGSSGK